MPANGVAEVEHMNSRNILVLAAVLAFAAIALPVDAAAKVYRWVDENGVVHFGDAIPPEYSKERHEVLDPRGVRTTVNEQQEAAGAVQLDDRDRALLATYTRVDEIEDVLERRTGFLDAQNDVARNRLAGLRAREAALEGNPAAINELATVKQRIGEYDAEIARRNIEIERIRADLEQDIQRFRELKGLDAPAESLADGKAAPEK